MNDTTTAPKQRITVVGAGLMGHGIALEFAAAGHPVQLQDTTDDALDRARGHIASALQLMASHGIISAEQAADAPGNITYTTNLAAAASTADIVIEAVYEDLALKQEIFRVLDESAPEHAILASNSSSYMPGLLASVTNRPAQVLVAHYFNPPHLVPLVELVRHPETSDASVDTLFALYRAIGKEPVIIQKEAPGFVANRLQMAIWREAANIVARGIATEEDVDRVVRTGFGRRYAAAGPFELGALISPDVRRAVAAEIMPDLANGVADRDRGSYTRTPEQNAATRQRVARALLAIAALEKQETP